VDPQRYGRGDPSASGHRCPARNCRWSRHSSRQEPRPARRPDRQLALAAGVVVGPGGGRAAAASPRERDVNEPNRRGASPSDVARREGNVAIIALLEERGAKGHRPHPLPLARTWARSRPVGAGAVPPRSSSRRERRELNRCSLPDGREFLFARERTPRGTVILTRGSRASADTSLPQLSASRAGPASESTCS